jgi:hypothetical protein
MVDATQQSCFTGAARADDYDDLAAFDREVDAIQDGELAKTFDDLVSAYHFDAAGFLIVHTSLPSSDH